MSQTEIEKRYRQLHRCLADPSRKSPRGPYRHAYTEEQFERRLKDERTLPLLDGGFAAPPALADRLSREQALELLAASGLTRRQMRICRMRLDGHTAPEIGAAVGISERRVWGVLREVRDILRIRLAGEDRLDPPGIPSYGWQEVFLESQRKRGG
jgi:DNA-binding CsgD family transcriptional regulator